MAKLWGWWTSHKLQILEDYLQAFVTAASRVDERIYLDLFAGWPDNVSRDTDQQILGSVHRALRVRPPFTRLGLFEIGRKAQRLEEAIRKQYPDRGGIRVYAGDCNAQVAHALSDLREVCWAPTFVFVDQFASEIRWSTLAQIAGFRRAKTKAELWLLFAPSQYPRGLGIRGPEINVAYGETLTQMLGTDEWLHIVEGRRRGVLTPAAARAEWVNLMRWRLQHELGYAASHAFTMKNTSGTDIYDMIFASDHPAGDRIMRHLYGKALSEHEGMRQHALALRRDRRRAEEAGEVALFPITPGMVDPTTIDADRVYLHEPPHEPYRLPRSDR